MQKRYVVAGLAVAYVWRMVAVACQERQQLDMLAIRLEAQAAEMRDRIMVREYIAGRGPWVES